MSSHDARHEDEAARDEQDQPGTTTTRTDQPGGHPADWPVDQDQAHDRAYDRGDTVADGGPVLLPVDAPEPTTDSGTAPDRAPVTIVDAGDPVNSDRADGDTDRADPALDATVGPDTESGALKDPIPDGAFSADTGRPDAEPAAATTPGRPVTSTDDGWRDLQSRFVDDPEEAVREAGAKVEKALGELRSRIENGSTEDLRTAFRRYRDLHAGLS